MRLFDNKFRVVPLVAGMLMSICLVTISLSPSTAAADEFAQYQGAGASQIQARLNIMRQYLSVIESVHAIADDPEKTVLMTLQQMEEQYKKRNEYNKIIAMYKNVLSKNSSQTLRNIAYMKLGEIYRRTGNDAESMNLLNQSLQENMKRVK